MLRPSVYLLRLFYSYWNRKSENPTKYSISWSLIGRMVFMLCLKVFRKDSMPLASFANVAFGPLIPNMPATRLMSTLFLCSKS